MGSSDSLNTKGDTETVSGVNKTTFESLPDLSGKIEFSEEEIAAISVSLQKGAQIEQLADMQKWNEALELLSANDNQGTLNIAITQLARKNAPSWVIERVSKLGGALPDNALFLIFEDLEIETLKSLDSYDLNLEYTHPVFGNALAMAVEVDSTPEVIQYLFERGVGLPTVSKHSNPMETLAKRAIVNGDLNSLESMRLILQNGMKIEPSVYNLASKYQKKNPEVFSLVDSHFEG